MNGRGLNPDAKGQTASGAEETSRYGKKRDEDLMSSSRFLPPICRIII
jgi:hypothetical protein